MEGDIENCLKLSDSWMTAFACGGPAGWMELGQSARRVVVAARSAAGQLKGMDHFGSPGWNKLFRCTEGSRVHRPPGPTGWQRLCYFNSGPRTTRSTFPRVRSIPKATMKFMAPSKVPSRRRSGGTSLAEVVIAIAIGSMSIGATVTGYVLAAHRSEWSAYSLAAQSLAIQRMEQTRSAKWTPSSYPPVDEVTSTNFPARLEILDVPISGTNVVYATNVTTITTVSASPPVKMVRVDCVWRFAHHGVFTNTIASYRSPDQ